MKNESVTGSEEKGGILKMKIKSVQAFVTLCLGQHGPCDVG
jgi:hypothetical protein